MNIQTHYSLKNWNTFGVDETAAAFVSVESVDALKVALQHPDYKQQFILGGGSNILLTQPIQGLCIHVNLKGISIVEENHAEVIVEAQAGENWHAFVQWSIEQGYGGMENLALIPGNVGTSAIQNIGAYGVELKDIFVNCTAIHRQTLKERIFSLNEAQLDYRSSVFKTELKNQYVITKLQVCLTKKNHRISIDYGSIKEALANNTPTPKNIAEAVIGIRKQKLPDPLEIGNSGSFFKNPILKRSHFEKLKKKHPLLPAYPVNDSMIKVPAAWLIDTLGFKGLRRGDAGVHANQALVLVNYGQANGLEILAIAKEIQAAIKKEFNIDLDAEVSVY